MRSWLVGIIIFSILLIGGVLVYINQTKEVPIEKTETETPETKAPFKTKKIIGHSVLGRSIESYTYGQGDKEIIFVGGIHGGYEWNTVLLAYKLMDYLEANPEFVPASLTITIIPSANPDGVFKVTGKEGRFLASDVPDGLEPPFGRFNANDVDLNRNFDCKWQSESTWRNQPVSAGTAPFSEPEAEAIKNIVLEHQPEAVVFWHSQSNAVYPGYCQEGISAGSRMLMDLYAKASGYRAIESFDHYKITGDAEGWLATIGIPAITVELKTHQSIEWDENLAGVTALIDYYK
ncbi:MAG: M14 family zinc carboxypeptidase [Patescibacteria group bacterium]